MKISLNNVVLGGNLCRDPEMRYTANGTAVCTAAVAVSKTWKDKAGEKQERTSFFDVVAFGRTAEILAQYRRKGDALLVQGELTQETWEDKGTGKTRHAVKVVADRVHLVGQSKGLDDAPGAHAGSGPPPAAPYASASHTPSGPPSGRSPEATHAEEDNVPF